MESLYTEFLNLKKVKESMKVSGGYIWYLQNFDHFHEIPVNVKEREYRKYRRYLDSLQMYLSDFFRRAQPLAEFGIVEKQINDDFAFKWKEGTIRGWESTLNNPSTEQSFYCDACDKNFYNENSYIVICNLLSRISMERSI
jgi:splicing factor 3A subunit 3